MSVLMAGSNCPQRENHLVNDRKSNADLMTQSIRDLVNAELAIDCNAKYERVRREYPCIVIPDEERRAWRDLIESFDHRPEVSAEKGLKRIRKLLQLLRVPVLQGVDVVL